MINGKANTIMIQNGASVLYITIALIVATIVQAIVNLAMGYFFLIKLEENQLQLP